MSKSPRPAADASPEFVPPWRLRHHHVQSIYPSLPLRRPGVERRAAPLLRHAADALVDKLFLPRIHPSVFTALSLTARPVTGEALGIIETVTAAVCIVAADAAAKAAEVNLVELRMADGLGGKSFVLMEGSVADVEAGVAAGVAKVTAEGLLVRKVVISHLHPAVREKIL